MWVQQRSGPNEAEARGEAEALRAEAAGFGRWAARVADIGATLRGRLAGLGVPPDAVVWRGESAPSRSTGRVGDDRGADGLGRAHAAGAAATTARVAASGRLRACADLADVLAAIGVVVRRLAEDVAACGDDRVAAVSLAAEHGFALGAGGEIRVVPGQFLGSSPGVFPARQTPAERLLSEARAGYGRAAASRWVAAEERQRAADRLAAGALRDLAGRADVLARRHPARWVDCFVGEDALAALALAGVRLPVDSAAVDAVAREVRTQVGRGPLSDLSLRTIERALARFLPDEREALVRALDAPTLARLGRQVGCDDAGNPLDRHTRLRVMGAIVAAAPREMLATVARDFPSLNPALVGIPDPSGPRAGGRGGGRGGDHGDAGGPGASGGPGRGFAYAGRTAPLVADGISGDDVEQGRLSDCFFLAPLMGLARAHPDQIARDLRANPNGTVTVTFVRGGQAVPVTVTPDLPYDPGARSFPFARTALPGRPAETWPALYEKAYAQLNGSYGELEGGIAGQAMADLTGTPVHRWKPGHHSAAQLRAQLAEGGVVTAGTSGGRLLGVFGTSPGPLASRHEYLVTAVDARGVVTLRNPWGPDATKRLTWSQVREHVAVLTVGSS
jgi:hypothetical protein